MPSQKQPEFARIGRLGALSALLLAGVALLGQASHGKSAGITAQNDSNIVKDFEARVTKYMDLRKNEAGSPPKPTGSTAKLSETQEQMAERIRSARAGARRGDIFTPAIADYFRRQIALALAGPEGVRIRTSLRHAEPLRRFALKVNEKYPEGVPLQSTPPTLLLKLPKLPKELQYRIVGNNLVLYDTAPNIVVDFIANAVPQS